MSLPPLNPLHPDDVARAFAEQEKRDAAGRERAARERSLLHGDELSPGSAQDGPERQLLQQARAGVLHLPAWMFDGASDREALIAALVFEARMAGLARIDNVVPSASGTGAYAIQGQHGDADHRSVYVDHSAAAARAIDEQRERAREDEELARRRAAERAAMAQPDAPANPLQRLRSLLP
jgi:hypothetical protein